MLLAYSNRPAISAEHDRASGHSLIVIGTALSTTLVFPLLRFPPWTVYRAKSRRYELSLYSSHVIKFCTARDEAIVKSLTLAVSAMFLMTLGIVCLFYPERFRELNLKLRGSWVKPMPSLISNRHQLWSIRISGAGAVLMGLLFSWLLWATR